MTGIMLSPRISHLEDKINDLQPGSTGRTEQIAALRAELAQLRGDVPIAEDVLLRDIALTYVIRCQRNRSGDVVLAPEHLKLTVPMHTLRDWHRRGVLHARLSERLRDAGYGVCVG